MSHRRRSVKARRKLKGAAATGSLLAAALIALTAAPASAATGIVSPSDGATFTGGSGVGIKAQVDGLLTSGKLMLRRPTEDSFTTVDRGSGTLSYQLPLTGSRAAPNGTYTVRLETGVLVLHGTQGKRTFTVRVPARQPTGLSAEARSPQEVRLQWNRGSEPDLVSYDVLTSDGQAVRTGLSAGRICGSSLCSTTVTAPAGSAGGTVGFTVRAHRSTAPGSSDTVASPRSQSATVNLPGQASPSPSVTASGVSPAPGASASSSAAGASPHPRLQPLSSTSSSPLGLPPIGGSQGNSGSQSFSAPLPELPSEGPGGGEASGPGGAPTSWTAVTGSAQWLKTVAVVLILLLVAAHMGGLRRRHRSRTIGQFRGHSGHAPAVAPASGGTAGGDAGNRRGTRSPKGMRSAMGAYRGRRRRP
ncbi:MAG: hypothetical protein GEV03_00340 [Streptosporangiales bacterium]|nr:hypothetical protein [Streptosporangiales bacterium]